MYPALRGDFVSSSFPAVFYCGLSWQKNGTKRSKKADMIKTLRKRHLQIWSLWALLLPLGIIAATLARKPVVKDNFAQTHNRTAWPVLIAEKKLSENSLQLRTNPAGTVRQLVWLNREPLTVPSATIYLAKTDTATMAGAAYIGRIETRGTYMFSLPVQSEYHFLLYDFIHQQIIGRLAFREKEIKQPLNTASPNTNSQTLRHEQ